MMLQQMDTMAGTMQQIEALVSQNLSSLNDRIQELSARVDQLRMTDTPSYRFLTKEDPVSSRGSLGRAARPVRWQGSLLR
jgi:hypothetical protein